MPLNASQIKTDLLAWYDASQRRLPWRSPSDQKGGGQQADPYRVWLSEIMLQQTVVATVIPYFQRFTARWPTVEALAAAPLDDVLTEWAGLGYYARARNLHKCAGVVARALGGVFPSAPADLMKLPGIGAYTAGAIAAIAFGLPCAAVDGNVERVTARLAAIQTPLPAAKPALRRIAESLVPQSRAGDFAQALMDLGATICTPTSPKCQSCPLTRHCRAFETGTQARLPLRSPKPEKPTRYGQVYWAVDGQGAVLVRRRPESGLLGGMIEFPSTGWSGGDDAPPLAAPWRSLPGRVRHSFTHFHLELEVLTAICRQGQPGLWIAPERFDRIALPSLMRKVALHAARHNDIIVSDVMT
jgi:A/G-specific adenine glycosylase